MDEKEFVDCALKELKEYARANEVVQIHEQTIWLVTSGIKRFYHEGWNLIDVVDYFKCQEDFAPELDEDVAINEMLRLRAKYEQEHEIKMNNEEKTNKMTVKDVWPAFKELIEDPEFGDDMSTDEEISPLFDDICAKTGVSGDQELLEKFKRYVFNAAHDYYYAESAYNAPGSRVGHRQDARKWSRLAKNVLRQLMGKRAHGGEERTEIEKFLAMQKLPDFSDKLPEYTSGANVMALALSESFDMTRSHAATAVNAFLKLKDANCEHPRYWEEEFDSAALRLWSKRHRTSKKHGT